MSRFSPLDDVRDYEFSTHRCLAMDISFTERRNDTTRCNSSPVASYKADRDEECLEGENTFNRARLNKCPSNSLEHRDDARKSTT